MIDIHTHILPGMDDGAGNLEESLKMCSLGRANHIRKTVVTPHFNSAGDIDNFLSIRDEKIKLLKNQVSDNNIGMEIFPGAEVFVDDDIFYSKNLKRVTVNNSRYLLVEFDFYGNRLQNIFEYLNELYSMGVVPIIAHPERYEYFQRDYDAVNELAARGVLFQLNAGSLASRDGREEFELAYEMAYKGIASFIATDAHSLRRRPNDLDEMLRVFPRDINPDFMRRMVHSNPERILNDEEIPPIRFARLEKRRFY